MAVTSPPSMLNWVSPACACPLADGVGPTAASALYCTAPYCPCVLTSGGAGAVTAEGRERSSRASRWSRGRDDCPSRRGALLGDFGAFRELLTAIAAPGTSRTRAPRLSRARPDTHRQRGDRPFMTGGGGAYCPRRQRAWRRN